MSATSTSGAGAGPGDASSASPVQEDALRSSPGNAVSGGFLTQAVAFSSGNPRIEETRGILHLYLEEHPDSSSPPLLPVRRKPLVCVLSVPNHMTYADFCRFCGSFIQHILEMRIVRSDDAVDQYSVIIRFDEQSSTDNFYQHFNGRKFSSLEVDVCYVRYTVDIQYTGSIEHAQSPATSSAEQPSCPVCLERLDQDTSGILTTICNHSFHCSCISKWTDSSCPVCRYCQQQPEKSTCSVCGSSENLWICVICGFVGCGRYREGHAIIHWKDTQHCYSLELETQRVWDYVGDNYVHRLIQSKTDGKLVELNFHGAHAEGVCGACECDTDSNFNEAVVNSKIAAIDAEYNDLLKTQLENQRKHYESCLLQIKEETEKEKSEAIEKAIRLKLHKLQANLERCIEEKRFLREINENLVKNRDMWKSQLSQIEERERASVKFKDDKIKILEKQLEDLMLQIDPPNATNDPPAGSTGSDAR